MLKAYHLETCKHKVLHEDVSMMGMYEWYRCKCGKRFCVVYWSGDR